jgi:hypothetical protein
LAAPLSYHASSHPLDDGVIDCGISFENAGDQIPNHILHVKEVSKTFIHLSFVNIRMSNGPVCINLKKGDTLDLGDDNRFRAISLEPTDEYDQDDDEADDADEDREEDDVDGDKEDDKTDVKKPPLSPKRCDDKDEEEPSPPNTSKADADAGLGLDGHEAANAKEAANTDVNKVSHAKEAADANADPDPNFVNKSIFGKKDASILMRLFGHDQGHDGSLHPTLPRLIVAPDEGHVQGFIPIYPAPVKVPRAAKMPTKRP